MKTTFRRLGNGGIKWIFMRDFGASIPMDRRGFLKRLAATGAVSASFRAWCAEHGADYDFPAAASACGWDPDANDAFYFLHASDLHMTENPDWDRGALQMKDKFMGRCFIDEINAMNRLPVRPSMLFLTGDLTSGVTMDPRTWSWAERKWAHYKKYVTGRLAVPWRQFIGNNDCAHKNRTPRRTLRGDHDSGRARIHGRRRWLPRVLLPRWTHNRLCAPLAYAERRPHWLCARRSPLTQCAILPEWSSATERPARRRRWDRACTSSI